MAADEPEHGARTARPPSLLIGRSQHALDAHAERVIEEALLAFDYRGPRDFDRSPGSHTRFVVTTNEDGREEGRLSFGADVFPGPDVANPNARVDHIAVVAHEITHHRRWETRRELTDAKLTEIDEAMTSLQAALEFWPHLSASQIQQLISDALQRLTRHALENA